MSSSASSPSSSPPPEPVAKKGNKKSKAKGTTQVQVDEHGKNEGTDPDWAYQPPDGTVLQENPDSGEFDWDSQNDDDELELWLIRVPEKMKTKYLENVTIEMPQGSLSANVGKISRKSHSYDIWSVGEGDDRPTGGDEVGSLECFLPRKSKKDDMYLAPRSITRRLVISETAVLPTAAENQGEEPYRNPPRPSYPKELLKHSFKPYGSNAEQLLADEAMVLDEQVAEEPVQETSRAKGKKRKDDGTGEKKKAKKPKK
ncbi:DNA-directed RNA polymerase I subunit RPA34.5-domain-containing protein [Armillaria novae-zelandiae]|uniref:DNA-directed RNA polymerase I subunit RPA34.5-domain-containing protein n=1 Tax=Armillaria novae-zelandiae TaxID=153914 RepID=A0AA39U0B7_9AGAR|nr:DNA-directed RNA polymerase I subunit RPA34.5-domain-containing protein [Armillaria novae-zelandiae]